MLWILLIIKYHWRVIVGDGKNHKYLYLPCLADKMRLVGATNATLGEAAGTAAPTVQRAKNGQHVRLNLGIAMYEALNTRTFKRSPCGAKT